MKVYELIAKLSEMPAGAEVKIRTLKTLAEFADSPVMDTENGAELYMMNLEVKEVIKDYGDSVVLYD